MNKAQTVISIVLNNFKNDSRVLKEAKTLQNNGYTVTVVALHEKPLKEYEQVENFNVHRIKLTSRSWSKNKIIQLLKYFEFIFRAVKKYHTSDTFHCHDLSTLPIGIIIKMLFNRKAFVVYDAHEYETETNGLSGLRKQGTKILERLLIKHADAVITVSNSIAKAYAQLYKIKKPYLVLNTPPYQKLAKKNLFRNEFDISNNQNIFLYQGKLSKGRGVEILLEVFSQQTISENTIVFMGYGPLEKTIKDIADQAPNIFYKSAVPPRVILDYTASADYGISLIEDLCLSYRYCLPNKMFEYIMAGVPVICSNLFEMKNLIEEHKLGVIAESTSKQGMLTAIEKITAFAKENNENNFCKAQKIFNWETQEKVLLGIYHNQHSN